MLTSTPLTSTPAHQRAPPGQGAAAEGRCRRWGYQGEGAAGHQVRHPVRRRQAGGPR
jgi:hypothetical protein